MRMGFGDDPTAVWRQLPPLTWYAGVTDLKPGAVVLVEGPEDASGRRTPLIVSQRSGRGSTLFVGTDELWKWRYLVGNRYFYSFWGQAIQHVGMPHRVGAMQTVRIETPGRPIAPGLVVPVRVAMDPAQVTDTMDDLRLIAEPADGGTSPTSFVLNRSADVPFIYEGDVALEAQGRHRLFVEGYDGQGEANVDVSLGAEADRELANPVVNPALLRQLANLTDGAFVRPEGLPALLAEMDLSPVRYRWAERTPLWDGWTMLLLLATLLGAEWGLRKWRYLP
jgi:hypothetical protein